MRGSSRSRSDEALAVALAEGATVSAASLTASVSEATAYRRLNDADFKARVAELRAEMTSRACGVLSAAMSDAAKVLVELSKTGTKDDAVKLRAAQAIIDSTMKATDLIEMKRDIEEMRRLLQRDGGGEA